MYIKFRTCSVLAGRNHLNEQARDQPNYGLADPSPPRSNDFYLPAFARVEEGGGGRHPVVFFTVKSELRKKTIA